MSERWKSFYRVQDTFAVFFLFFFIKNKSSVRDIRSTSQSFSKHSNSTSILSNRRRFVRRTIFFFFFSMKKNQRGWLSFLFLLQNFVFRLFFNRKKFRSNEIVSYRILKLYSRNKLWLKYGKGINSIHFDFIAPFFSFSIFISIIR